MLHDCTVAREPWHGPEAARRYAGARTRRVNLLRESMHLFCESRVLAHQPFQERGLGVVMLRHGLLSLLHAVLADEHKGRQEDGFQAHDHGQQAERERVERGTNEPKDDDR